VLVKRATLFEECQHGRREFDGSPPDTGRHSLLTQEWQHSKTLWCKVIIHSHKWVTSFTPFRSDLERHVAKIQLKHEVKCLGQYFLRHFSESIPASKASAIEYSESKDRGIYGHHSFSRSIISLSPSEPWQTSHSTDYLEQREPWSRHYHNLVQLVRI
jgi:hypothetical protein